MSGIAIKVPNVNWSANNVGKVTFIGGEGTSSEAQKLYDDYISKSGRAGNSNLLMFISALVDAGLMSKCTGLFYLASESNNIEHIRYSITDLRSLTVSGSPTISSKGIKGGSNIRLTDGAGYNMSAKGFCCAFMVSEAATAAGIDWGGDLLGKVFVFTSFGSAPYTSNVIFRWNGAGDDAGTIRSTEDTTEKKGVYVMYAKGTSFLYKHNNISLSKTINQAASGNANPALLNFTSTLNTPTTATQKVYATFNNDLTTDEVDRIQTIFDQYKDLI